MPVPYRPARARGRRTSGQCARPVRNANAAAGSQLHPVVTAALAGFAVSLFVEFTQLTGNWFLYPCPCRLFDVDDLIASTVGALAARCCGGCPGSAAVRRPRTRPGR